MFGEKNRCNAIYKYRISTTKTLLLITGLFHLFILVLLGFGISSDPFPCSCLGPLLTRSVSNPNLDIQPFLEQESTISIFSITEYRRDNSLGPFSILLELQ
jgi:hypothetical protein